MNNRRVGLSSIVGSIILGIIALGLDVLPEEPPLPNDKENFFRNWLEQTEMYRGIVIVNPHTAFYSPSSIIEMRCNAAKMALNALKGLQICNRII